MSALPLLSAALFVSGWIVGRWDLGGGRSDRPGSERWLRGNTLLLVCACLVFAGILYLQLTSPASRILGPTLLQRPE